MIYIIFAILTLVFVLLYWKNRKDILLLASHIDKTAAKKSPTTFRVSYSITPNWHEIIRLASSELDMDYDDLLTKVVENKDKHFWYEDEISWTQFRDNNTGMEIIWSDFHKTFVKEPKIIGTLLPDKIRHNSKHRDKNVSKLIEITPSYVGFQSDLPDGSVQDEDMIAKFPFFEIIDFLLMVAERGYDPMQGISRFPKGIRKILQESKITYSTEDYDDFGTGVEYSEEIDKSDWLTDKDIALYEDPLTNHVFKCKYADLYINIEVFEKPLE